MTPNTQQIALLQHTIGVSEHQRLPYRNHFVAGPGHTDLPNLKALEADGLMELGRSPKFLPEDDMVFRATAAGEAVAIAALPEPAPRTRYGDYLDSDTCDSFGEFLVGAALPEFEQEGCRWGRGPVRYRMFRCKWGYYERYRDVQGEWCATKKAAKASYKLALKALQQSARAAALSEKS